jgi:hypothetical protein
VLRIHNCYLPHWLHRLFNGVLVGALSVTLGIVGLTLFSDVPVLSGIFAALLFGSPVLAVTAALIAHRFSLVHGIAAGDGYDDLK